MLDSFEKAKIKYPTSEIYTSGGLFGTDDMLNPEAKDVEKCHPAKYCMTVEQFLKDGHKFVEGDIVSLGSRWNDTVTKSEIDSYNEPDEDDCLIYILRAAALNKPKRVKVEYVKCDFSQAWEAVKEHEENRNIFHCQDSDSLNDDYPICGYDMHIIGECARDGELYRRIETPIEWYDDLVEFINQSTGDSRSASANRETLHVRASMSRDKWCDFARMLLEQAKD